MGPVSYRVPLIWGSVLIVIGLVGMAALWALGPPALTPAGTGTFSSNGQLIYYTGGDASGSIPRSVGGSGMTGFGMMGNMACVVCQGEDGRGGRVGMMFGTVEIPDIRYSSLTSPRSEAGTTVPAWSESDIARAIRDGFEPNGQPLKAPMPLWDMTDAQLSAVIGYMKELDGQ